MTPDDADAGVKDPSPTSFARIARAAATWLRHEREHRGLRYVAVPTHDAPRSGVSGLVHEGEEAAPAGPGAATVSPRSSVSAVSPLPKGQRPAASAPEGSPPHAVVAANKLPVLATAAAKLDYLRTRNVGDCQRCGLARTRQHLVFGVGDAGAEVMFVGEAPGAEEDARGEPFVGAAGRRLDEWLATVELVRSSVYIANVLKCRPPRNRDPEPDEIAKCSPFLHAQIRAIGPRVIVALGRFAGQQLLGGDGTLASMRGQGRWYVEPKSNTRIPVVVTYHPSYVLRREAESQRDAGRKSENDAVIEDLRIALAHVERR